MIKICLLARVKMNMTTQAQVLDDVFAALSDASRRRIIEAVKEKDRTVLELAGLFDISLPAVSKHLKVLDKAGLLQREKDGRYIKCHYNPEPMSKAVKWILEQQKFWNDSFDALETFLAKNTITEKSNDGNR